VNKNLEKFIIKLPVSLNQVLKKINYNAKGVVFVINRKNKLVGSISDGDIRRAILKNKLNKIIKKKSSIINLKPIYLASDSNI
jgi:CBS domain-containing protein